MAGIEDNQYMPRAVTIGLAAVHDLDLLRVRSLSLSSMGCSSSQPVAPAPASGRVVFTRPPDAVGAFLRMIMINDVYILDNYPKVAAAVVSARKLSESQNCVVTSHLNGDFLSPCIHTALDGGTTMMQALNYAQLDYACLGNHEFDMNKKQLQVRLPIFKGQFPRHVQQEACEAPIDPCLAP